MKTIEGRYTVIAGTEIAHVHPPEPIWTNRRKLAALKVVSTGWCVIAILLAIKGAFDVLL